MSNKQTSVEWLVKEIETHYIVNNATLDPKIVMQLQRQANEMFKEQIESAVIFGDYRGKVQTYVSAEQYYKETYGN